MSKIETDKFNKGVIEAMNYYFGDNKTERMTDEEYQAFLHDIEKAYFHLREIKDHYGVEVKYKME